ncbi:MAG: cupin domain-containing protein [Elusimicrobia bacterium]|nr:cupin domain-containing protein [Elusimicrobiota bacterium]
MAELERKNYQIWGKQRNEALKKFKLAMKKFGLTMPAVKPQLLDFGSGKFYKTGLIEYWVANEDKEGYCGKFLFVFGGQTCPYHHHDFKHETFFILKGSVSMKVNGKKTTKKQGGIVVMPPGVDHSFTGIGNALLLEVSKPCQPNDNLFEDKSIGENGVL